MKSPSRTLWKYEKQQARRITGHLIERRKVPFGWGITFLPNLIVEMLRFHRSLALTRKNLLFTRQKAFDAARRIAKGEDRALQTGHIEVETRELLDREKKGFYTEKVRRRQIREIELLIDHFLSLLNTGEKDFEEMVRGAYPSRKQYMSFLNRLQQAEQEVVQAAVTTMRKGSRRERLDWFRKVQETTRKDRLEEANRLYPD